MPPSTAYGRLNLTADDSPRQRSMGGDGHPADQPAGGVISAGGPPLVTGAELSRPRAGAVTGDAENREIDSSRAAVPEQVSAPLGELAGELREGLLALAVGTGLQVMAALMEADVTAACGPKGRHGARGSPRAPTTLWGSRSRPAVVTCGDRRNPAPGHDHGRCRFACLPDLRPTPQLADPVWPHNLVQGHRAARAAPRGRRAAENQPEAAPGLGRPSAVRCNQHAGDSDMR